MRIRLDGEAARDAFGRRIARHLSPPCLISLQGDLGAGKTTLVRGVLLGLGYTGPVRSPTYTLLELKSQQRCAAYRFADNFS